MPKLVRFITQQQHVVYINPAFITSIEETSRYVGGHYYPSSRVDMNNVVSFDVKMIPKDIIDELNQKEGDYEIQS